MNRSLNPTYNRFVDKTRWIESLILRGRALDASSQHLVGELAILYLAISIEQTLEDICLKICCGATYLDGSSPVLVTKCRSSGHAQSQLKAFKSLRYMKWLNTGDVVGNIKFVVDSSDPIFNKLSIYSQSLDVIRAIRNHVAHRSKSTLQQYRAVVRNKYGPTSKALAPGAFLMSERRSRPSQINTSIIEARVLVRDIIRG
jgi:hypothetical protein